METEIICLIQQAQRGSTRAFDAIVHRFQDRAVGYARSLLHDSGAAEDAAQEAFVQAWHDLGQLREPVAFPAWFRRIIFKHCDRARRAKRLTLVSFDPALLVTGGLEPAAYLEKSWEVDQVRFTLETLPEREREIALLYYLGERDLGEVAAFLGIPGTTVKNRLHAARKRLRKELWEMAEAILEKEKPSNNEEFAGTVLARIAEEFYRQMAADPHTADRKLLPAGREKLYSLLARPEPLDFKTVIMGFHVLYWQDDLKAVAALLMRYLSQPLDDSHTAWAYFHLANAIAGGGDAAGAVLAHLAFEKWLPGKKPRLFVPWPHEPAPDSYEGTKLYQGEKDILLCALGKSVEFATAWRGVWRENEYLDKVDAALAAAEITPNNQWPRFWCLRMAATLCESSGNFARAHGYVNRMYAMAKEPPGDFDMPESWLAHAIGHDIQLRRSEKDEEGVARKTDEMAQLIGGKKHTAWARGERHDLACKYIWGGQYEKALPLFEQNANSGGQVNA